MWCLVIQIPSLFLLSVKYSKLVLLTAVHRALARAAPGLVQGRPWAGEASAQAAVLGGRCPGPGGAAGCVCAEGLGLSLTFVFSRAPRRFQSRRVQGLLLADEPVEPPSSQLPELRVAVHEPPRAQGRLLLRGRGVGVLRHPGVCHPGPTRRLRHGLVSGGAAGALLENQAGPLQQQEAAGHQVRCGEEEEQKLRPTEKLLQPEESSGHALAEAGPFTPPDRPPNPRLAERRFLA